MTQMPDRLHREAKDNNVGRHAERDYSRRAFMTTYLVRGRWLHLALIVIAAMVVGGWFQASPPSGSEVPAYDAPGPG
jgi:hypothetical protein